MNQIARCRKAKKITQSNDKNFERHIAECAECRKSQQIFDWMREFAAQTAPPQNLPAPGFLLFKARLIEQQSVAKRAVQPIVRMNIASAVIFASAIVWLLVKIQAPIGSLMKETFSSLSSVAPVFILAGRARF